MSQYGAYAQALPGRTVNQILQTYYPGTTPHDDLRHGAAAGQPARPHACRHPAGGRNATHRRRAPSTAGSTGASKAVTFTAGDTVVVRPNSRNGQDVLLGGKVVASTAAGKAALRVTWTGTRAWAGRPPRCRSPARACYRSHSAQAYRYGEMAISRTGAALNLVNVLRLGDEYVRGIPESPFYWGPYGGAALQAQALAARTFAYTAYLAGVSAGCDCHVYDGTMSQTYDGYRVDQDPNARYWASAIAATDNSVITYQGRPINATYYSGSGGRTMDVRDVWGASVPYLRSVPDPWSLMRTVAGHPVGNGNVSWTVTVSQATMSRAVGLSGLRSVQITRRTTGGSPAELTATSVTGAKVARTFTTSEQLRRAFGLKAPWVTAITAS